MTRDVCQPVFGIKMPSMEGNNPKERKEGRKIKKSFHQSDFWEIEAQLGHGSWLLLLSEEIIDDVI